MVKSIRKGRLKMNSHERLLKAKKKLKEKNMDMIIFNDVTEAGAGFDVDTNKVMIIGGEKEIKMGIDRHLHLWLLQIDDITHTGSLRRNYW